MGLFKQLAAEAAEHDRTNRLAAVFARAQGWTVPKGFDFSNKEDMRSARANECYVLARLALDFVASETRAEKAATKKTSKQSSQY